MIALIANPSSRSGKGRALWTTWEQGLRGHGADYNLLVTASREDCVEKARQSICNGETPVAVGGDGTINATLTGAMLAAAEDRVARMGVLYAGTSPDFCRFHGIPTDAQGALQTLLDGTTASIDVCSVEFAAPGGAAASGYFACGCNIGLGAATAQFANKWRKTLGDALGTGLGLVLAMLRQRTFACRMEADGERLEFERARHIMILKNPHVASGLRVDANIKPDDGAITLLVIHDLSPLGLLSLLPAAYSGELAGKKGVYARRCAAVRVETFPKQPVEFDGDAHGATPASIRVLPKALKIIHTAPQGTKHE